MTTCITILDQGRDPYGGRRTIAMGRHFPEVVCLCGSTRFFETFQEIGLRETLAGRIVLSIGCNLREDRQIWADSVNRATIKVQLDELHKRKIDLADRVLVLNVGGYIGESTRSEIDYALAKGKPIDYLEPTSWGARIDLPKPDPSGPAYPQET